MSPYRPAGAGSLLAFLLFYLPAAHGGFIQSYQATGNLGLYSAAVGNGNGPFNSLSGSFNLLQLPFGSTIQKAYLYTADFRSSSLLLTINALPPVPATTTAQDAALSTVTLTSFRWDLTNTLSAMPPVPFNFSITSNNSSSLLYAAALMIVWSDPTAPTTTVTIVDGAQQVGELTPSVTDTESISFTGLPAGATALTLFTVGDDGFGTGETVRYNSGIDHGPLNGNLGTTATLLQFNETSLAGSNSLVLTSSQDWFGWVASASVVTPAAIPEPSSLALLLLGSLSGLVGIRLRRRRRP
jgi:hypothetical protein